jgi:7,8-didemethyl-8-hydroxy-5-deazariboflavin synthase CofH subunit
VSALEHMLNPVSADVRRILETCLGGGRLEVGDAVRLCAARGADLHALLAAADRLRQQQAGDVVSYVVNRNINFTNVCVKACKFCAFSRTNRSEEAYYLDTDEVVRRALEAQEVGATEVCVQAGLPPRAQPNLYLDLLRALKAAAPALHVHAFSPEEVKYGAELAGLSLPEYLQALKESGLGSLPGTSAEILDDRVRKRLAGGRITTAEWIDVITTAHRVGLPTTATIMYGHIESDEERMRHLELLRSIQEDTGGFTEFVPLSFVHAEAPLHMKHMLPDVRPGPSGDDVMRLIAISRLMLGASFKNLQTSWVKEGLRQAQWLLSCVANDLGGTLINESISTSAGASHGQLMAPATLRRAIRDAGRTPAERTTGYQLLRTFSLDGADDPVHPLDLIDDPEARFGSYRQLTERARSQGAEARRRLELIS